MSGIRFPKTPKISRYWGDIYRAEWRDDLNGRRLLSNLFRRINGKWMSGEAHSTGIYGSLLREAPPAVAKALDAFSLISA
jgi:hypothetical protein